MASLRLILPLVAVSSLASAIESSDGDANSLYRTCVEQCEKTGCVGDRCFQQCKFLSDGKPIDGPWYMQEPLYQRWKQWDCQSDCQYHCMLAREEERKKLGDKPVKYHGKWPLQRVYGIQEPVAAALSALSLAIQFHGWVSFSILIYYKLPLRSDKMTYYEYTGLLHICGFLAMNALFWSGVFHTRCAELTEKLSYSSGVAFFGFALILAIVRVFSIKDGAARVMAAAPPVAFLAIHILYISIYDLNANLNKTVCLAAAAGQLLMWAIWAGVTSHPSRGKLLVFVLGGLAATLLKVYDFPPYHRFVDAHAVGLAVSIPLSFLWWSFFKDDAEFRTATHHKKSK